MDGTLDQMPCYLMLQQKHQVSNYNIIIMLFGNIEWFSNDCQKTHTQVITLTNRNRANSTTKQSEFLAQGTGTMLCIQGAFGFGFVSFSF